ncbi:hypothetical protein ABH922_001613 [Rhodococcus sp. 27YEA15]
MRVFESLGDLTDDVDGASRFEPRRFDSHCSVCPGHVLHRDPELTVLTPTIENRHDVRVIESRSMVGLTFGQSTRVLIVGQRPVQQFQRDLPGYTRMSSQVHRTHATDAQQPLDRESGQKPCRESARPPSSRQKSRPSQQVSACFVELNHVGYNTYCRTSSSRTPLRDNAARTPHPGATVHRGQSGDDRTGSQ